MGYSICRCVVFAAVLTVSVACGASSAADEKQAYFPARSFDRGYAGSDELVRDRYSKVLQALEEPPLLDAKPQSEHPVLRFTNIPTFHRPSAFRIFDEAGKYYLALKIADGRGGFDPGTLTISQVTELNSDTFQKFQVSFRDAPVCDAPPDPNAGNVVDGSSWVFEVAGAGSYCVVERWMPTGGVYHRLGIAVARIAGVEIPY